MPVKVSSSFQVRIPVALRKKLGIRAGDYLEFEDKGREVVVRARRLVDAEQTYFWTEAWQRAEREAEEDIQSGRVSKIYEPEEIDHLIRDLRKSVRKRSHATAKKP